MAPLILPAINCSDIKCVAEKIKILKKFLPKSAWVHLDVTDARFTFNKTWGDPQEWKAIGGDFNLEVHLMVEEPASAVRSWLAAGAKRLIVHVETLPKDDSSVFQEILTVCKHHGADVMLAANPETRVQELLEYQGKCSWFQTLAVHPGFAGQRFYPLVLDKVRRLRAVIPDAHIEVDGGITLETAKPAKEAGADILVSASYIFQHSDPKEAYEQLTSF